MAPALFESVRARLGAAVGRGAPRLERRLLDTWPHRALDEAWTALHDAPAVRAPVRSGRLSRPPRSRRARCLRARARSRSGRDRAEPGDWSRRPSRWASASPPCCSRTRTRSHWAALALGAVLWASIVQRAGDTGRALRGVVLAALVIAVSGGVAVAGLTPSAAHLDWRGWDPFAEGGRTANVSYVWDANYEGIEFPARPTVVLRVRAPKRAEYWRVSTLETFAGDRWIENLYPIALAGPRRRLPADPLVPQRDARPDRWLKQQVTVEGLEESRLAAAAQAARIEGSFGRVLYNDGGIMRSGGAIRRGTEYTVWSYSPSPTPRALAASPPRYPEATERYLELGRARAPAYGVPGRERDARPAVHGRPLPAALRLPAALGGGTPPHRACPLAVRGDAAARALVPARRQLPLRGAAAAGGGTAARRLRRADAGRLLPALRRRDGADAADDRDPRARRRRLHRRDVEGRRVDGDRPPGARLGRGVVRRSRLARVRPDAGAGHPLGRLHARLGLGRRGRGARHRPLPRLQPGAHAAERRRPRDTRRACGRATAVRGGSSRSSGSRSSRSPRSWAPSAFDAAGGSAGGRRASSQPACAPSSCPPSPTAVRSSIRMRRSASSGARRSVSWRSPWRRSCTRSPSRGSGHPSVRGRRRSRRAGSCAASSRSRGRASGPASACGARSRCARSGPG